MLKKAKKYTISIKNSKKYYGKFFCDIKKGQPNTLFLCMLFNTLQYILLLQHPQKRI